MPRKLRRKLLIAGVGIPIFLGVLELGLRVVAPTSDRFFVWPPLFRKTYQPIEQDCPGITGMSQFRINSLGLRGDELEDEDELRILAIGGSTTECLLLDQAEAWPQIVQEQLGAAQDRRVWVGNAGRSGHSTREHILQVPRLLDAIPGTEFVLLLAVGNDLHLRMGSKRYDPKFLERDGAEARLMPRAFAVCPLEYAVDQPIYKRTELYARARQLRALFRAKLGHPEDGGSGASLARWRDNRRNAARILTELPDLERALDEYERNLHRIADEVQARGAQPVFLTQPTLWHAGLSEQDAELLWGGGIGAFQEPDARVDYWALEALTQSIDSYNAVVRTVCEERGIPCVDLDALLPGDSGVLYDDVHFNEEGARRVAALVTEELKKLLAAS